MSSRQSQPCPPEYGWEDKQSKNIAFRELQEVLGWERSSSSSFSVIQTVGSDQRMGGSLPKRKKAHINCSTTTVHSRDDRFFVKQSASGCFGCGIIGHSLKEIDDIVIGNSFLIDLKLDLLVTVSQETNRATDSISKIVHCGHCLDGTLLDWANPGAK
eukprot:scaffold770_cov109-Cylindrotheca_fusiformis.AAC.24